VAIERQGGYYVECSSSELRCVYTLGER